MTAQLPSWPATPPVYGSVVLRAFTDEDAHLAVELGDDPYIPLIGSLPAHPTAQQALEWIQPWNRSSIHVAEAAGYRREGLLRSHQEIGGTRRDMLLYATTRPRDQGLASTSKVAASGAGIQASGGTWSQPSRAASSSTPA
jgi:hypothetical protein